MPIKATVFRFQTNALIFLALAALSLIFQLQPIVLFPGMVLSLSSLTLLFTVCLYGFKGSVSASFFAYGAAAVLGAIDLQSAVIHIVAIAFIAWRMKTKPDRLITHTLMFWLLAGGPLMALSATITNGSIGLIGVFHIQKEITIALISSLIVDIIFTYIPLKRIGYGRNLQKGFHFNRIMVHTTLAAITIPYLLYVGVAGYNSTKRIVGSVDSTFVSQIQMIESYLRSQTENDLFALKQQGVVQVSRLDQELHNISSDTGTEIVVTDHNNKVMGSNSTAPRGYPFIWHMGGSVAAEIGTINYWVPDRKFSSELEKWSYAYIIREKELPPLRLKAIMMTPFAPYLSSLMDSYVYQLWVYLFFCSAMFILSSLFNRIFFKPLEKLAETTTGIPTRLADGNRIEWHKSSIVEIDTLVHNFKTVTDNLEGMFHRTHHMAYYDSLTGLPNRLSMQDALTTLFSSHISDKNLALLFFDLDRFKQVNDSLGHAVGDRLLQAIASRLKTIKSDCIHIFRISGDEFVAIADGMDQKLAEHIARHILGLIRQPIYIDQHELHITSSIGIALYPQHGDNPETLMRLADASMYIAKEEGRNTYVLYTESLQSKLSEQIWIEHQLHKALDLNQLNLHYQAIVDGVTSEIHGIEALIRWNHPEKGLISPVQFIPIAEQSGLIIPIGQWVLKEACLQNKKWQDAGFQKVRIAVNLSARQFYSERLTDEIRAILKETGLEPQYLELEITEGFMIKDPGYVNNVLNDLRAMGVTVSIDDFGTGYSSLGQLKNFPVNAVKIDRSFIQNIGTDRNNISIVKAIIELAHGMNLKVVAEGIETEVERNLLLQHHCDEMQGYYFARPMDADKFANTWQQKMSGSTLLESLRL
ncbi:MAG TPA: EAL domain-containing protein [Pseudobacteroides sp.]|uniref:putative bifunctional diguanylate cyclase/phosphodiesterase n=1 Tax=Pseudobacteroides sp. TaxID=1968840 RepID=UPI002F9315BF